MGAGTPKSSISIGFSTINHPVLGTPILGLVVVFRVGCVGPSSYPSVEIATIELFKPQTHR